MLRPIPWWIFLFAFSFLQPATAQNTDFQFRHISIADGLADDLVHGILMDSKGIVWMATHDGLSRYDGHHFKNYKVNIQDSQGLQGAVLMNIQEGEDNNYWIACNGMGLIKFNAQEEIFSTFSHEPNNENSLAADGTTSIFIDDEKRIWVSAYQGGLNLFDAVTEKFKRFPLSENLNPADVFMKNSVVAIAADPLDKNKLWLAALEGICHFDKLTGEVVRYPLNESYPPYAVSILADDDGTVWVGTESHGLVKFNSITKQSEFLMDYAQVKMITRKSPDEIWVATIKNGLGIFNQKNNTWKYLRDSDSKSYAILSNDVYGVYQDKDQRLWVRDMTLGVSVSNGSGSNFLSPQMTDEVKSALVNFKKFAYVPQTKELLAASMIDARIFIFQKTTTAYLHTKTLLPPFEPDVDNRVLDIFTTSDQRTLVLAKTKTDIHLFQYEPSDSILQKIPMPELEILEATDEGFASIAEDKNGTIWFAFSTGKLLGWTSNSVLQKRVGESIKKNPGPQIWDIVFDNENHLWAASLTDGVCRLNLDTNEELYFSYDAGWFDGWRIPSIEALKDGKIWVGTSAAGIYELDSENLDTNSVIAYNQNNGMPDDKINGIQLDAAGNIWIATARGLVKYYADNQHFTQFGKENGLANTFLNLGLELLPNGDLIIGQPNGFMVLNSASAAETDEPHPVRFSALMVNGKKYPTAQELNSMEKLELETEENYFTIQFSANYFDDGEKVSYRYFLKNYDREWTTTTKGEAQAHFTNVPPGRYTFQVTAADKTGNWNTKPAEMDIIIRPYWYWSSLMKMVYGIVLLGILVAVWRMQRKRYILNTQLKLEKSEASRLKELDGMKSRFFANVSHELRTPITLMLSPIGSLLKSDELSNKQFTLLNVAQQNGKDLLKLIGSILDLSKMESGKLTLENQPTHLFPFIRRLVTNFDSHAERLNVRYTFEYNIPKELKVELDQQKMEIILNNLLSNALKFTPEKGSVSISADDLENMFQISVQDTGRGIHSDDLPHIFDRFYQARKDAQTEGGTGIGLAVSQEYIKLMDGKIWVESELGKGSTFFVQIPRKEVLGWTPADLDISDELSVERNFIKKENGLVTDTNVEHQPTVMVVEDNHSLRDYLQTILSPHFNLILAENGQIALHRLEAIAAHPTSDTPMPELILSDIMMPVMNGYELLETLRAAADFQHLPVVMLTARADIQDRLTALRIGVDDYLLKPFDEEELLLRIQNLLTNYAKRSAYLSEGKSKMDASKTPAKKEKTMTEEDQQYLAQLEKIILEYMADSRFNMDFLGYQMASSRRQLQRKIKKLIGLTPKEYVNEVRLHEARKLLETGKTNSVKATAYQVGYADPQYFSAQFKIRFGKTPSSYLD